MLSSRAIENIYFILVPDANSGGDIIESQRLQSVNRNGSCGRMIVSVLNALIRSCFESEMVALPGVDVYR